MVEVEKVCLELGLGGISRAGELSWLLTGAVKDEQGNGAKTGVLCCPIK